MLYFHIPFSALVPANENFVDSMEMLNAFAKVNCIVSFNIITDCCGTATSQTGNRCHRFAFTVSLLVDCGLANVELWSTTSHW